MSRYKVRAELISSPRKPSATGHIKWLVLFVYWRIFAGQTYKYLQTHSQTAKYPQNCNFLCLKVTVSVPYIASCHVKWK